MNSTAKLQTDPPARQDKGFFRAVAAAFRRYRLGDLLVMRGVITPAQLQSALAEQKETGARLGEILVRRQALSAFQLYSKLAEQWCLRISTAGLALILQAAAPSAAHAEESLTTRFTLAAATLAPADKTPGYPRLFGTREFRSDDISAFKKWTAALQRFERQAQAPETESPGIERWQSMLRQFQGKAPREQMEGINRFFNQAAYIEDAQNYGRNDYWATPVELLKNGGDCEDFAIAKYASLRALGFSAQQLRIAIVHDEIKNVAHAVLIVYDGGEGFVLDNQDKKVEALSAVSRYKPIFSINSDSWWLHKA